MAQYGPCVGSSAYEHEGKLYCVLHFPSEDKEDNFEKALDEKLEKKDFNFAGAFSPEALRSLSLLHALRSLSIMSL